MKVSNRLIKFNKIITKAMKNKSLILFNRFATFGRNLYRNGLFTALKPACVFSNVDWWGKLTYPYVFSEEKKSKVRYKDTNQNIDNIIKIIKSIIYINQLTPVFSVWQNTDEYEKLAKILSGWVLAVPSKIGLYLEDKSNFNTLLKNAGVSACFRLNESLYKNKDALLDYKTLCRNFGRKFVLQGNGMGGRGTIIVESPQNVDLAKKNLKGKIRATEYYDGFSVNVNILTIPNTKNKCSVYVSLPSYKATSIQQIGVDRVISAGSDWSLTFPKSHTFDFIRCIEKIGYYAYKYFGLIGVWGLDSIWNKNGFRFNELNCRVQGTTDVASVNELERDMPPFLALHYLVFLKQKNNWYNLLPDAREYNNETIKKMVKITGRRPFYLKIKVRGNKPIRFKSLLKSGIYKITSKEELKWLNAYEFTSRADFDMDEILVANLPKKVTTCYPKSQICTLEGVTSSRHIFDGQHNLSKDGIRISRIIYKYFQEIK